jgi:hypothetical protein
MVRDDLKTDLFVCTCGDVQHQLIVRYWKGLVHKEDKPEVFVEVLLNPELNIWKRIVNAVRYIFGYRSKYGDFDEVILEPSDYKKIYNIARYLRTAHDFEVHEEGKKEHDAQEADNGDNDEPSSNQDSDIDTISEGNEQG